jgi:hypothetical protein
MFQPVFTSGMEETVQEAPDRESEWWTAGGSTSVGSGAGQDRLIMPLLRFLQLLCEGHYLKMQKFLHEQPGSQKSFDVVSQTCALFEVTIRHIQPAIVPVAVKGPRPLLCVHAFAVACCDPFVFLLQLSQR